MSDLIKWPIVRLSELAAKKKNATVGGPFGSNLVCNDYVSEGVPVVRGANLPKDDRFSCEKFVFVSENKADSLKQNMAIPGDLVFTQRGTLGQVGIIPFGTKYKRFLISQSQMKMSVDKTKADATYLYYYFRLPSTVSYIENHALQSGVPHINLGILRKLEVVSPPLEIQKKIAAILSAYDELIENNKRRIALLEKMAEEIYREWFVRFRFPGYRQAEFVKGIPQGWESNEIDRICSEIRAGVKKKNINGDERYMGLEHLSRKSISIKEYDTADSINSNKLKFEVRDILFGKIRPYLHKVSLAHFSGLCSTDTIVIRPDEAKYEGFLLFTVFSETFVELASVASKGTKMPRADWDFLKKLKIVIPPPGLAKEFQAKFDNVFAQIENLLLTNENLNQTKISLLPRLISRKLNVEDLDIQFPPSMQEDNVA